MNSFLKKIEKTIGLDLSDSKEYLVQNRLLPVMMKYKIESLEAIIEIFNSDKNPNLNRDVYEALLTHETYFFREPKLYDYLCEEIIPDLIKKKDGRLVRILCCACSTGQEPYSIVISLLEKFDIKKMNSVEIYASDICSNCIDKAKKAAYSEVEVRRGLKVEQIEKFFSVIDQKYEFLASYKNKVKFFQQNLLGELKDPYELFDIVLLRNVLIYFSDDVKKQVLENICKILTPSGLLFVGGAEIVKGLQQLKKIDSGHWKQNAFVKIK